MLLWRPPPWCPAGLEGRGERKRGLPPTARAPFLDLQLRAPRGAFQLTPDVHSRFGLPLGSFQVILEGWGERKTHHCFSGTLNSGVFLPATIYCLFACLLFGFFWLHRVVYRIPVPRDRTPGSQQGKCMGPNLWTTRDVPALFTVHHRSQITALCVLSRTVRETGWGEPTPFTICVTLGRLRRLYHTTSVIFRSGW